MVKTNSDGKLSLDMLIGLSIFLVTFIFIAQLLPSVFADVRREITLAHEAYKVTVMLSEMRGMWSDGMNSGVDWENRQICNDAITFLPGLSEGEPDFLSLEKVLKFNEFANQCPEKFRKALGLDVSNVRFHVSIESFSSTSYKRIPVKYREGDNVRNLLDAGYPLPEGGFVKYERYIWLRPDVNLLGVLDLNTGGKRRACPTTQCDCSRVNIAQEADCSFNLTYPLKEFYVIVYDIYSHGQGESSSISICVDKEEKSGTCSVGSKNVSVQIDKLRMYQYR
ncbi:MAG: hypothetical protein PWQ22_1683 [Archaeoglobaceae archaeon]|nr:hypothetical protein [Archaeoglobaceae archaeon]